MLNVNATSLQNKNNSKVSFGTNLNIGQGVIDRLNKHPEDLQKIQEFKDYLAKDGKNWNAELTYDTFKPTTPSPIAETETLIRKSANGYDYDSKRAASKLISQMKSEDAAALIKKLSTDKNTEVQAMAASQVSEIRDKKIAAALVDELVKSANSRVKEEAIYSLESIKDETLKNKLIEKYINSDDATVKRSTVEIAYKAPDIEVFNNDLEKYSKDADPKIRQAVFHKILDLSTEEYDKNAALYDSIIKSGLSDSDSSVKETAGEAIGRIKDPNEAAKLINELLENSTESWSRRYIAASAGFIKDPKVAIPLIEKLLTHHDTRVRYGAAQAAMKSENQEIRNKFVEKFSNDPNPTIRREVSYEIGSIEDAGKQKELIEKYSLDPDANVREDAAWMIGFVNDVEVRNSLIDKYIKSNDFEIKRGMISTASHLVWKDSEKAKEIAQTLSKDPDKAIQKEANAVLEEIKNDENQDHYNLKITDGGNVVGNKIVKEDSNVFDSLFSSYKTIFETFVNKK